MQLKKKRYILAGFAVALVAIVLPALAIASPISGETLAATKVGSKVATLNGKVDTGTELPKSQIVYGFEYGTTTAYGSETEGEVGETGTGIVEVDHPVTGLKPSTTYHFRLVVVGEGKTTYGKDLTFTTLPLQQVGVYNDVSGDQVKAEMYPTALTGTQDSEFPVVLTVNKRSIKCGTTQFSTELTAASSSLSLTPLYEGCTFFSSESGSISMNSCKWTLNVNSGANSGGTTGKWGVACSKEGDVIEIIAGEGSCTLTIAAQTPVGSVGFSTVGAGQEQRIAASLAVVGLKINVSGPLVSCGTNGLRENTSLVGGVTFKGLETP